MKISLQSFFQIQELENIYILILKFSFSKTIRWMDWELKEGQHAQSLLSDKSWLLFRLNHLKNY